MSVWPEPCTSDSVALSGTEGELILVTIAVEPQLLERLLEALAAVRFPINPHIYHDARMTYVYPKGSETAEPTTIVEFSAYRGQLDEVRNLLTQEGFDPDSLLAKNLLDEIHSSFDAEAAPPGASYGMERTKATALTEAVESTIDTGQEAQSDILAKVPVSFDKADAAIGGNSG